MRAARACETEPTDWAAAHTTSLCTRYATNSHAGAGDRTGRKWKAGVTSGIDTRS